MTVISGLSSMTGMSCRLFITRHDELIVEDPVSKRVIPLDDIERMAIFYGKTIETMNDIQIGAAAGFHSIPRFYHVRSWINRNPVSRKKLFLAVRFLTPLVAAEYSEMAVFSDIRNTGNLNAFRLRPEIAVRTAILPRRSRRKDKAFRRRAEPSSVPPADPLQKANRPDSMESGKQKASLSAPLALLSAVPRSFDSGNNAPFASIDQPLAREREQMTEPYLIQDIFAAERKTAENHASDPADAKGENTEAYTGHP